MKNPTKPRKCSICRRYTVLGHGHNAQPINDGRCCSSCNDIVVIPTRLKNLHKAFFKA